GVRCSTAAAVAPVVVAASPASLQWSTLARLSARSVPPRAAHPAAPTTAPRDDASPHGRCLVRLAAALAPAGPEVALRQRTAADSTALLPWRLVFAAVPAAAPTAAHHDGVLRRALRSERTAVSALAERKAAHWPSPPADCLERLFRRSYPAVVPA